MSLIVYTPSFTREPVIYRGRREDIEERFISAILANPAAHTGMEPAEVVAFVQRDVQASVDTQAQLARIFGQAVADPTKFDHLRKERK